MPHVAAAAPPAAPALDSWPQLLLCRRAPAHCARRLRLTCCCSLVAWLCVERVCVKLCVVQCAVCGPVWTCSCVARCGVAVESRMYYTLHVLLRQYGGLPSSTLDVLRFFLPLYRAELCILYTHCIRYPGPRTTYHVHDSHTSLALCCGLRAVRAPVARRAPAGAAPWRPPAPPRSFVLARVHFMIPPPFHSAVPSGPRRASLKHAVRGTQHEHDAAARGVGSVNAGRGVVVIEAGSLIRCHVVHLRVGIAQPRRQR